MNFWLICCLLSNSTMFTRSNYICSLRVTLGAAHEFLKYHVGLYFRVLSLTSICRREFKPNLNVTGFSIRCCINVHVLCLCILLFLTCPKRASFHYHLKVFYYPPIQSTARRSSPRHIYTRLLCQLQTGSSKPSCKCNHMSCLVSTHHAISWFILRLTFQVPDSILFLVFCLQRWIHPVGWNSMS